MEFNELFEKYSLEDIASKTNIPKEKLKNIKERNWEGFIKPQVIGFLNILKREYKVDIDHEIEEVKEFFKNKTNNKAIASIDMVDSVVSNDNEGYFLSKIIYLLTILALAYAGWYYYNKEFESSSIKTDTNSSIIAETINSVKTLVGGDGKSLNNEVNNSLKNSKIEIEKKDLKEEKNKINLNAQENSIKEGNKFDIYSQTKDKNESNITVVETNNTNKTISTENRNIKRVVNKLLEENKSNMQKLNESNLAVEENKTLTNTLTINENNTTTNNLEQENNTTTLELATIKSIAKSTWLGIYNLKTKKRETKLLRRNKELELNLNDGNYAIVTGHNKFKVIINNEEKLFPKRGKVYFLISKENGLKIINKKEYREVTNKKAW